VICSVILDRGDIARGGFRLEASFNLPGTGVTALYGPSGCGKTSLLRCLAGLEPDARVSFDANSDRQWPRRIGYVFQDDRLFPHLDVAANLAFARDRALSGRGISIDQAVDGCGLGSLLRRSPASLSGGERRRVAIARVLVNGPDLLLLDEPLTGLDSVASGEILAMLQPLVAQIQVPVLYVSHQLEEVVRLADGLLVMRAGSILADGPLAQVLCRVDLAIARQDNTASILDGQVSGHEPDYGLTDLSVAPGVTLSVQGMSADVGSRHRLLVHARDVSLALDKAGDSSILNILPASVDTLEEIDAFSVLVRLAIGDQFLLARITRKSRDRLGLVAGATVWAQVKSLSLMAAYY